MNNVYKIQEVKWEISLILSGFFAAFMWVVIKLLDNYFWIFQQIFLRSTIALLLCFIVYRFFLGKFNFSAITKKDVYVLLWRSLLQLSAIWLWVMAITETSLANATLISCIPATALIWMILYSEKLSKKAFFYIIISLLWAIIISIDQNFKIGQWELYALISTFLFSFAALLRKKISHNIWDKEISTLAIMITSIYAWIYILIFERDFSQFVINYSHSTLLYLILWGILFLLISFSVIYGFKRVSAIKASNIEYLEILFAIILGIVFFSEYPTLKDIIWWLLVVLWAFCMLSYKENSYKET